MGHSIVEALVLSVKQIYEHRSMFLFQITGHTKDASSSVVSSTMDPTAEVKKSKIKKEIETHHGECNIHF